MFVIREFRSVVSAGPHFVSKYLRGAVSQPQAHTRSFWADYIFYIYAVHANTTGSTYIYAIRVGSVITYLVGTLGMPAVLCVCIFVGLVAVEGTSLARTSYVFNSVDSAFFED